MDHHCEKLLKLLRGISTMFKLFNTVFNKDVVLITATQLVISIIGALFVYLVIQYHATPSIATVNLTGLVDSFVHETSKQSLSPADMKKRTTLFGENLNKVVHDYARKKHVVLLPSEVVMAGSPDLTSEVANQVKQEMLR
jgi:type-F conjugative transfer system protein TrbI